MAQATESNGDHGAPAAEQLERAWSLRDSDPRRSEHLLSVAPGERAARAVVEGLLCFRRGEPAAALDHAVVANRLLASRPAGTWHHRLAGLLAAIHLDVGLFAAALDQLHQASALAEEMDDRAGVFDCHHRMGELLRVMHDHDGAAASLALAERYLDGSEERAAWLSVGRATLLAAKGDWGQAHHLVADAADASPPPEALTAAMHARAVLAASAAQLDRVDLARRALGAAVELASTVDRPVYGLLAIEAMLELRQGNLDAAQRLAKAAADAYRAADRRPPSHLAQLQADLAAAAGDYHTAHDVLRAAQDESIDRSARFRTKGRELQRFGHTSELRRQAEALKRVNEQLASSNRALLRLNHHVVELSARDPLTGLYNRRQLFLEAGVLLRLARRHGRPLSVAMVDIDRFKAVNDRYFHSTGDTVLREVGTLLTGGVRDSDLVGRYGGDEFVLLLPEVPRAGAAVLCERVRHSIASHGWDRVANGLGVTVTIGIAEAAEGESAEELLHRADERLYLAKSLGRNRVAS
jgi:diguanylate cyclase (GGDEF)-like protein